MADAAERPDFAALLQEGAEHFNRLEFWEAHESWETLWLAADESHRFLQGLIQLAAAYHHVKRGTFRGAVRLFDAALEKLEPFPPLYCGIDRHGLVTAAREHRARIAQTPVALDDREYPRIELVSDWIAAIPARW